MTRTVRTSTGRPARTTRTKAPPTLTAGCIARRPVARRNCLIWATSPWRTVTAWRWQACSARPLARPSGAPPRRCWRSDASSPAVVSRWARTRPTTRPIMRRSAIDGRTTRHTGYAKSQSRRAMIECIFGWGKQHGTLRKTKHRGIRRVAGDFLLNLIAYNLVRIPKLVSA